MKVKSPLTALSAQDYSREVSRIHYRFEQLKHDMLNNGLKDAEFYLDIAYTLFTRDVEQKLKRFYR